MITFQFGSLACFILLHPLVSLLKLDWVLSPKLSSSVDVHPQKLHSEGLISSMNISLIDFSHFLYPK